MKGVIFQVFMIQGVKSAWRMDQTPTSGAIHESQKRRLYTDCCCSELRYFRAQWTEYWTGEEKECILPASLHDILRSPHWLAGGIWRTLNPWGYKFCKKKNTSRKTFGWPSQGSDNKPFREAAIAHLPSLKGGYFLEKLCRLKVCQFFELLTNYCFKSFY